MKKKLISVVSPVYAGEEVIELLVERIKQTCIAITSDYEIILVDDGSPDKSWELISKICEGDDRIVGIQLDKNYGQHPAIKAGLENCSGEWIAVMDCDLQDPPEEIRRLYENTSEDIEAVIALRKKEWQPLIRRFYSGVFYFLLSLFSGYDFKSNTANFGIYRRTMIEQALSIRQRYFIFPLAVRMTTKKIKYLPVQFDPGINRKSAYTFSKVMILAFTSLVSQTVFYPQKSGNRQNYVISEVKRKEIL